MVISVLLSQMTEQLLIIRNVLIIHKKQGAGDRVFQGGKQRKGWGIMGEEKGISAMPGELSLQRSVPLSRNGRSVISQWTLHYLAMDAPL